MRLTRTLVTLLGLYATGFLLASCAQQPADNAQANAQPVTQEQDENAIRALDAGWVRVVSAKDADKSTSFYDEQGTLMAPGAQIATGKAAIRKTWGGLMATPGFALTFSPGTIRISKSGDMAYELGTYALTTNDKKGKPQTVKANYVVVWGKQADGRWKALVDAPTTTQ